MSFQACDHFHIINSHIQISLYGLTHPQNSLKDSNASSKVKAMEEGIEVRSLIRNISRVKGAC